MNKELDNTILDIFYNEIIGEMEEGTLSIGDLKPAIKLSFKENNHSYVKINDKSAFDKALISYVKKAVKFYYNDVFSYINIKSAISYVFANITISDYDNIENYLNMRTRFLNYDYEEEISDSFLEYSSKISISKSKDFLEAPGCFKYTILYDSSLFELPTIYYAVDGNCAYVYAIQNKNKYKNNLQKKINRLLYKINNGYIEENYDEILNGKDITMSFVASLILFIKYLKMKDITEIKLITNMPVRHKAHIESNNRRLNYHKKKYNDEEYNDYKKEIERKNDVYNNVHKKLLRTFYRVLKDGNVLNAFPSNELISSTINFNINYNGSFNNEFCNQLLEHNSKIK